MQIAGVVGSPIEKVVDRLPRGWQDGITGISRDALSKAAEVAIWSMDSTQIAAPKDTLHKLAVSLSGVAAGAFGLSALAIELPLSTTIMLRSVSDIARAEGEDIDTPDTKLACVQVFALGGRRGSADAAEPAYYLARAALANVVTEASQYLANGGSAVAAPAMLRFVSQVASRFQIRVTEKVAAQSLPIIGAAGGALLNNLFISHYQSLARAHFTLRRLERVYSPELIRAAYSSC